MMASFDMCSSVLFIVFALVAGSAGSPGVIRRQSLSAIDLHVDGSTQRLVLGGAGKQEPKKIIRKAVDNAGIRTDSKFDAEILRQTASDAKAATIALPRIIRNERVRQEPEQLREGNHTDEVMTWFQNEGLKETILEATISCLAFMVISVIQKRLRRRDRRPGKSAKAASANNLRRSTQKTVTLVPTAPLAANVAASTAALGSRPTEPKTVSLAATGVGVTATRRDWGSAEATALVAAIKGGRAAELPHLLASLRARTPEGRGTDCPGTEDRILHTILRACAAQQCFKEALAAYDYWTESVADVGESKGIWSLVLYAAASSGTFSRCQGFYDKLCEEGPPSCHDFVNLVRALAHKEDLNGLHKAIDHIRNLDSRADFDAFTRNRALAACAGEKGENALELAAALLGAEIFTEPPDAVAYNTLMKGFSRQGRLERCFQLFSEMRTKALEPSEISFGILLDACVCAEDFDKARAVCQDLRQSGLRLNAVLCTTCIKGLAGAGRLDEAATMLEEMQRSPDAKPDLITYSTLVKAYADRGCVEDALETVRAMIAQRVRPDEIILNSVLSACVQSVVSSKEAFHVLDSLQKMGLRPSTASLSIFLKTLTHNGDYELALEFLLEVPQRCRGLHVEARLFAQIVQAATQAGQGDQAVAAFEAMCGTLRQRGQTVDSVTHARLVRHCMNCGQHATAARLREAARQVGFSHPLRDPATAAKAHYSRTNGTNKQVL